MYVFLFFFFVFYCTRVVAKRERILGFEDTLWFTTRDPIATNFSEKELHFCELRHWPSTFAFLFAFYGDLERNRGEGVIPDDFVLSRKRRTCYFSGCDFPIIVTSKPSDRRRVTRLNRGNFQPGRKKRKCEDRCVEHGRESFARDWNLSWFSKWIYIIALTSRCLRVSFRIAATEWDG